MTKRQPFGAQKIETRSKDHRDVQSREEQLSSTFSLQNTGGRIGLILVIIALTLIATPFVLDRLARETGTPVTAESAAEQWPTPPATYVAPEPPAELILRSQPTPVPLPAPQWREMSNLTVIEFQLSSVVNIQRRANVAILGEVVTDKLLLKATGEVQLGIDLSQVHDITINEKSIQFKVPKPEIVSVELLPEKSQIYDRYQALFLSNYTGLETEALEAARQQLRNDVYENSAMLALAEEYGKLKLTEFLRNVGYTDVDVTFVEGSVLP